MRERGRPSMPHGFTLTELLVVIAIIVLLTAIVVPNVVGIRTHAAVTTTEANIDNLKTALELYRQAFGSYPGDVFPSEDVNNNGVLEAGEDTGVNLDPTNPSDAGAEYGIANGRLDAGDGVINILDLEWAMRTSARGGPFLSEFPVDAWGQPYVYVATLQRVALDNTTADLLGIDNAIATEDANGNGVLDPGEDCGIGDYSAAYADACVAVGVVCCGDDNGPTLFAGSYNGVLDQGDDDNGDGLVTYADNTGPPDNAVAPNIRLTSQWELGNADISPDGLSRNLSYYLYSVGIDGVDDSHTGYEDITGENQLTIDLTALATGLDPSGTVRNNIAAPVNSEDVNAGVASTDLDTGYEDTGLDGRAHTKDLGEDDGQLTTGVAPTTEDFNNDGVLNLGGDDINSWNETRPWRRHESYN